MHKKKLDPSLERIILGLHLKNRLHNWYWSGSSNTTKIIQIKVKAAKLQQNITHENRKEGSLKDVKQNENRRPGISIS